MPARSIARRAASGDVPGTRRHGYAPRNRLTSVRIGGRECVRWEDADGVAPGDQLELRRREQVREVAKLGPARFDREVTAPDEPLDPDRIETRLEHAAVHPAAGEIEHHVRRVPRDPDRMQP